MAVTYIKSGGQTGIDKMSLEVGRKLGLKTGGTAPLGWKTENGPDYSLEGFGLIQSQSSDYTIRTIKNIQDSDGTVVFGNSKSVGSKLTIRMCGVHQKPYIINPSPVELNAWLNLNNIKTLNGAGNRASKLSVTKLKEYEDILTQALILNKIS